MSRFDLLLLAVGLSMDAFAVAVCKGLALPVFRLGDALTVGGYFGGFQALMPLLGCALGEMFADLIVSVDHWVAFVLLAVIGGNMVRESFSSNGEPANSSLRPGELLPLALATSVDALAVGVTFAFLGVEILPAAALIGCVTFLLSAAGVWLGRLFGGRFQSRAELAGGLLLVGMGTKILLEHLGALPV